MTLQLLVLLSSLFAITHIVLSHGAIRAGLVKVLGEWPFRGLYSVISLATLGPAAVLAWRHRHLGPVLWDLPRAVEIAVAVPLVLLAFNLLALSFVNPSPSGMRPARPEARGVLRITRHPMNMGIASFALAHLVANGAVGDVALLGSLAVVGLAGAYHQDARKRRERGTAFSGFLSESSVLPFGAILSGRNRIVLSELSLPAILVATLGFAAVVIFHGRLFGVALL